MRLKVRRLWWAIKRELPIQFGHEQLTSHGGLELVRRYFQLIGLNSRIRRALRKHGDGSDYGCTHLVWAPRPRRRQPGSRYKSVTIPCIPPNSMS